MGTTNVVRHLFQSVMSCVPQRKRRSMSTIPDAKCALVIPPTTHVKYISQFLQELSDTLM